MLSKSTKHNPNYLCKIVKIQKLRKHTNADRLLVFNVDGNDIITSNQTQEGTYGVYFPLECQISEEYLKANNEYKTKELNSDVNAPTGFFEEKRRVKALRLRGEKSMGYVAPISTFQYLLGDKYKSLEKLVGEEFDTINGNEIVRKYVVKRQQGLGGATQPKKAIKKSKLVDNQFRLHYDTSQLGKNLHRLQPKSIISLTWKMHGTSFVSSKVLCKRKLKWYEKLAKWFGVQVKEEVYDNLYSSRNVIKNDDITKNAQHYYGYDLWKDINEQFKDNLIDGETIYGEAVGFLQTGAYIQNDFDYGCKANQFKTYVYRITHTNAKGKVIDLPFNMVKERCEQLDVEAVPFIYFGPAEGFIQTEDFANMDDWREAFLDFLKVRYVHDQDSQFCSNKVPEEGIVLRIEGLVPDALKLKAFRFLEYETKSLDKGEGNIEDGQVEEID